jgi:hypothetical protein
LQVVPAAVISSPSAAAPPAASINEVLGIPAVGSGKGQTCMGRATSMVNEQLSLAALSDHVSFFSRIALAHHAYQAEFSWASQ